MMQTTLRLVLGLLLGLVGIAGLVLAAKGETPLSYDGGLTVFAVNYLAILVLIRNTWPKQRYQ